MRIAAGIMMIVVGIALLVNFVPRLVEHDIGTYDLPFSSLILVASASLFVTGGTFCLRRKYWKVCFASALLLLVLSGLLILILWVVWSLLPPSTPVSWIGFPSLWGFSQSYSLVSGEESGRNLSLDQIFSMSQHLRCFANDWST